MHPCVTTVQERRIPIRIRSAYHKSSEGTIIREKGDGSIPVKAVTAIKDLSIITTGGAGMIGIPSVVSRVFSTLASHNVNVVMISQSSSQANISMLIRTPELERALKALKVEFRNGDLIRDIHTIPKVAVVAIVGEHARHEECGEALLCSRQVRRNYWRVSQGSSNSTSPSRCRRRMSKRRIGGPRSLRPQQG